MLFPIIRKVTARLEKVNMCKTLKHRPAVLFIALRKRKETMIKTPYKTNSSPDLPTMVTSHSHSLRQPRLSWSLYQRQNTLRTSLKYHGPQLHLKELSQNTKAKKFSSYALRLVPYLLPEKLPSCHPLPAYSR
jgi:hypothetical protein